MAVRNNFYYFFVKVTLSENVQRVVELSQRIVVEKSVINQYEQVQKTSEISIENSKRVILSDNNSSSTSTTVEKSRELMLESNGMLQNCERICDKEFTVECKSKENDNDDSDGNCINNNNNNNNNNNIDELILKPKSSTSCNDLLMFGKQQSQSQQSPKEMVPTSAADFSIPYNIINNYFSGNSMRVANELLFDTNLISIYNKNSWRRCSDLCKISFGA